VDYEASLTNGYLSDKLRSHSRPRQRISFLSSKLWLNHSTYVLALFMMLAARRLQRAVGQCLVLAQVSVSHHCTDLPLITLKARLNSSTVLPAN
jgi:hypothetical protein